MQGVGWNHITHTFHCPHSSIHKLCIGATGFLLDSWTLKIGTIGCPNTSLRIYHYSLHDNPKYRSSRLHRGGSMKSRVLKELFVFSLYFFPADHEVHSIKCKSRKYETDTTNKLFTILLQKKVLRTDVMPVRVWITEKTQEDVSSISTWQIQTTKQQKFKQKWRKTMQWLNINHNSSEVRY